MTRGFLIRYKAAVVLLVFGSIIAVGAKTMKQPLVRIAELEIEPSQLPAYRDAQGRDRNFDTSRTGSAKIICGFRKRSAESDQNPGSIQRSGGIRITSANSAL